MALLRGPQGSSCPTAEGRVAWRCSVWFKEAEACVWFRLVSQCPWVKTQVYWKGENGFDGVKVRSHWYNWIINFDILTFQHD